MPAIPADFGILICTPPDKLSREREREREREKKERKREIGLVLS